MIGSIMNLLAIIIIVLAVAAAGAIIYVAWELSSDKSAINTADRLVNRRSAPQPAAPPDAETEEEPRSGRPEP